MRLQHAAIHVHWLPAITGSSSHPLQSHLLSAAQRAFLLIASAEMNSGLGAVTVTLPACAETQYHACENACSPKQLQRQTLHWAAKLLQGRPGMVRCTMQMRGRQHDASVVC
jgi:hypothetical protein